MIRIFKKKLWSISIKRNVVTYMSLVQMMSWKDGSTQWLGEEEA